MANYRRQRSRSSRMFPILIGLLLVGGTFGGLVYSGIVELPFLKAEAPFRINLPSNYRPIPAFTKVTREDLVNPETKTLHSVPLRPDQVLGMSFVGVDELGEKVSGKITSVERLGNEPIFVLDKGLKIPLVRTISIGNVTIQVSAIIGRVTRADKTPNYAFTEDNFLPEGSRPGVAGGTPAGMQAITLEANFLQGVHGLEPGDKIDLIANVPLDRMPLFDRVVSQMENSRLPGAGLVVDSSAPNAKSPRTEARAVAIDAVIVKPVTIRNKPETTSSLGQGKRVVSVPVPEVVIAVRNEDVPRLNDALGMDVTITCVVHSGRPEIEGANQIPPGHQRVPVSGRGLIVYSRISTEDFIDPKTGRERLVILPDEEIERRGILLDVEQIVGRVLRSEHSTGAPFTADSFLPEGSPAGLAGGVPAGKRMVTLDAGQISGCDALSLHGEFDLMATIPIEFLREGRNNSALLSAPLARLTGQKQAEMRVIVQGGVVVAPAGSPAIPNTLTPLKQQPSSEETGRKIVLAISPEEVARLTEALSIDAQLTVVVRSGRPDDPGIALETPGHNPLEGLRQTKMIVGDKQETIFFLPSEK